MPEINQHETAAQYINHIGHIKKKEEKPIHFKHSHWSITYI